MGAPNVKVVPNKNFAWSFSRLKNFESCPSRHQHVDILKDFEEDDSPELERGDRLHKAMHSRVQGDKPLPREFVYMEEWAQTLTKVFHPYQTIQCELKLGITRDYKTSAFFDRNVWYRGLLDYLKILPRKTPGSFYGHIVDYKTGKPKTDDTQLALNSCLVFCCYPDVDVVRADYLWTEYNDTTHMMFERKDMPRIWTDVLPRVARLEQAWRDNVYPAVKCGLCQHYCPVSSCEHWGKR